MCDLLHGMKDLGARFPTISYAYPFSMELQTCSPPTKIDACKVARAVIASSLCLYVVVCWRHFQIFGDLSCLLCTVFPV